ncbi:uncharacterized protein LAESUDRAFT_422648 [Laetiporus sulphureus 93-53]|uniref:Uncharacterized protein n=1 Tax=Laetiporus sulphureus 93-53 TaxID=1314785 RepID=A0A165GHT6_9APHY|nr:uncharacterized protein LAESUDRAFT_422648 [Laetiporus sulphureus 93-53]KZT10368.1 hypothetical protein LAESUDRAFT_422648 [Laetiporus sulphureus 93-53]
MTLQNNTCCRHRHTVPVVRRSAHEPSRWSAQPNASGCISRIARSCRTVSHCNSQHLKIVKRSSPTDAVLSVAPFRPRTGRAGLINLQHLGDCPSRSSRSLRITPELDLLGIHRSLDPDDAIEWRHGSAQFTLRAHLAVDNRAGSGDTRISTYVYCMGGLVRVGDRRSRAVYPSLSDSTVG